MSHFIFSESLGRSAAGALLPILAVSISASANAQSSNSQIPIYTKVDQNSVNLPGGGLLINVVDVSIGPDDHRGLRHKRTLFYNSAWQNNEVPLKSYSGNVYNVVISYLGSKYRFLWNSSTSSYDQIETTKSTIGASLSVDTKTFKTSDGVLFTFGLPTVNYGDRITNILYPDGTTKTFSYKYGAYCSGCTWDVVRLSSINTSTGYQLKYEYAADTNQYNNGEWNYRKFWDITKVTAINNSVEYCDPLADHCTLTGSWPTVSYTINISPGIPGLVNAVTNSKNETTQYSYNQGRLSAIRRPSSVADDVTWTYVNNSSAVYPEWQKVATVNNAGQLWSYSYSGSTAVSGPLAYSRVMTYVSSPEYRVVSDNINGRVQSYSYCASGDVNCPVGFMKKVASPEGNAVEYEYDLRGNTTKATSISKTPGSPANIVVSASYPACVGGNEAVCNQPEWTRDALGNQTDYTYNSAGQPLTVTQPAAAIGGTRPKVTYTYSDQYAWYKRTGSSIAQALTPVSMAATASTCLTGASCAGTASERKTTFVYQQGSSSVGSNLLMTSSEVKAGDSSVSASTSMTYGNLGDVLSVDGPISGIGDITAYKYDVLRRPVGVIGPDPDGSGTGNPNVAMRTSYDSKGWITSVEKGTTADQSDSAFSAFVADSATVLSYDVAGRVLTEKLIGGGTTHALTQNSYDARGRLDCTTVRMNPAVYTSFPGTGACVLGTQGGQGADRITKFSYNASDEVTQTQQGYLTSASVIEKMEYTPNGQVAAVIDGNNNRTTYEYDGHDRLVKTRYPVPTVGANASSTTDYEQRTYGDNVNVTNVRLRDGNDIALTFDKLNRSITRTPTGEGVVNLGYNLLGMPTTTERPSDGINVTKTYDALGRLTSETQPYGSVSYQYDPAGNRTRLTWSDGVYLAYDYDNAYRMTKIRENGATTGLGVLASYAYDGPGRLSTVTYGNGTSRTYAYDTADRLQGLQIDLAGTTNDLVIGKIGATGAAIAYNPASQITSIARSNDAYAFGGRYTVNRNYTTNGLNQYTLSGGVSLGYDGRGNLTSSGADTYTYSKLNELRTAPGATMAYDGLGHLIAYTVGSETTRFNYSGGHIIDERAAASGTVLRRYAPGSGTDEIVVWYEGSGTTDRRWLQGDERGSVVSVSDAAGNTIAINSYDEFGIPAATNVGRYQYTGQTWFSALGLYNYKARFYSPTLGRFMQTDPIGYGDGMNWYAYVGNDPVNFSDPTGMDMCADGSGDICVIGRPFVPSPINPNGSSGNGSQYFGWGQGGSASPSIFGSIPRLSAVTAASAAPLPQNSCPTPARLSSLDGFIDGAVDAFNGSADAGPVPLPSNLVKAMVAVESGYNAGAYASDPMQVNVPGDWDPRKSEWFLTRGGAPGKELGIVAGIGWLSYKAYRYNSSGNRASFLGWDEAARRYNGGGDPDYLRKVQAAKARIDQGC